MVKRSVDEAVAALARRQHGAFSHRQVREAGGDGALVRRRIEAGTWTDFAPGVCVLPGNPPTWERQAKAVELCHPEAILHDSTAAVIHSLDGFRRGRPKAMVPISCRGRSPLGEVCRSRRWVPGVEVDGFQVTDLIRTILDVAPRAADRLGRVLDDACLAGRLELDELADRLPEARSAHRRSVGLLAPLLDRRLEQVGAVESVLEGALLDALAEAGVEGNLLQQPPPWWPDGPQRVDVTIPSLRAIIEADGRSYHARLEAMDADRARDNRAGLHHWRVFRYTWFRLVRRREDVLAELRQLSAEQRVVA